MLQDGRKRIWAGIEQEIMEENDIEYVDFIDQQEDKDKDLKYNIKPTADIPTS